MKVFVIIASLITMLGLMGLGLYLRTTSKQIEKKKLKALFGGSVLTSLVIMLALAGAMLLSPSAAHAQTAHGEAVVETVNTNPNAGMGYIAAAIAVGLGSIGAAIAVGMSAAAAVGAISENQSVFGLTILFVGLAEGIAIYGLIIAIMILDKV